MTTTTSARPFDAARKPPEPPPVRVPRTPRKLPRFDADDMTALIGALLSSLALVAVFYEHIFDGSGTLGFLVIWYLIFLGVYAGVLSLSLDRPSVVERLVTTALWVAAAVVVFALGTTVVYTFVSGWAAVVHLNFFTRTAAGVSPTDPLNQGGLLHALVGSGIEVGIAIAVSVPLGVGTAIYMSDIGGRGARIVRTVVEAMTSLPEILAGLFVYVTLIVGYGLPKSGISVSVAMAVTMVPIIARSSEVSLRIVPSGLREASLALGASRWRTVWRVVLPNAKAGLATAAILGVARGVGETAIPLICSGASSFMNVNPFKNEMNSLPLYIYTYIKTGEHTAEQRAFGAGAVLITIVLILFFLTRLASRTKRPSR